MNRLAAVHPFRRLPWILLSLTFLIWLAGDAALVLAQDVATPATETAKPKTLIGVIQQGGLAMIPLVIISIWCMALIIEGFIRIRLPNFVPIDLIPQLRGAFAEENYQQVWRLCKSRPSFLTNIMCHGLARLGRGRTACEAALAEHSLKESMIYRTRISYLSTIGVISPMVGLLGTVFGMIKAFHQLGTGGIANPALLAAAIAEVLIATATGLLVAIPAFFLYYFLRNRLQLVIVLAEDVMNQLMLDVKYEELQGIKIGEEFETELVHGAPSLPKTGGRISGAIPTAVGMSAGGGLTCPQCRAPIVEGALRCNGCGTELQWT